jgi:hypothetical protein
LANVCKETDLIQSQLLGTLPKHKQHGINDVALSASIGTHDGGEAFVEGTDGFGACVGFKVGQFLSSL